MTQFITMPDGEYVPENLFIRFGISTFFPKEDFLPFKEARKFAINLKLSNVKEWKKYCKAGNKPNNIPSNPNIIYKNKWKGMGDFLGTDYIYRKDFLSFEEVKIFVKKLRIKNKKEWRAYCKSGNRPYNIPSNPDITYKNKWKGWGDFLGTGVPMKNKIFLTFEKTKKFAKKLEIRNCKEWFRYCKSGNKPYNIPSCPHRFYKDKWTSWKDFLGTNFLSFEKARKFVRNLKLKSQKEWKIYCQSGNKPNNIPMTLNITYKDKWIDWYDFLGKKRKTA